MSQQNDFAENTNFFFPGALKFIRRYICAVRIKESPGQISSYRIYIAELLIIIIPRVRTRETFLASKCLKFLKYASTLDVRSDERFMNISIGKYSDTLHIRSR